jgi:CRISPR-associated endonuclease/helicase Cas3
MERAFGKSERVSQVERLLLTSRVHLSQAEIARRCKVDRATIHRLIPQMIKQEIPVRYDDEGLLYIERTAYISTIKLKLHEAMSLFLAGRLLARYSDKPNPHTVEALGKLGAALTGYMPALGQHIGATSEVLRGRLPAQPGDYQRVLEKLAEAWAGGRKVQIWYKPLRSRRAIQQMFAPYFLEPSGIGFSVYAVGLAEPAGRLRTRKLERIERIIVTDEPFEVPPDFDPNALLAGAWGIWFDEEDRPARVELRFSGAQATRRLCETVWHPSQQLREEPDGRLVWSAEIDEPQEMLPWVRGWGADVEVLAPQELREQVLAELRRQVRVYGLGESRRDPEQPDPDLLGAMFGG